MSRDAATGQDAAGSTPNSRRRRQMMMVSPPPPGAADADQHWMEFERSVRESVSSSQTQPAQPGAGKSSTSQPMATSNPSTMSPRLSVNTSIHADPIVPPNLLKHTTGPDEEELSSLLREEMEKARQRVLARKRAALSSTASSPTTPVAPPNTAYPIHRSSFSAFDNPLPATRAAGPTRSLSVSTTATSSTFGSGSSSLPSNPTFSHPVSDTSFSSPSFSSTSSTVATLSNPAPSSYFHSARNDDDDEGWKPLASADSLTSTSAFFTVPPSPVTPTQPPPVLHHSTEDRMSSEPLPNPFTALPPPISSPPQSRPLARSNTNTPPTPRRRTPATTTLSRAQPTRSSSSSRVTAGHSTPTTTPPTTPHLRRRRSRSASLTPPSSPRTASPHASLDVINSSPRRNTHRPSPRPLPKQKHEPAPPTRIARVPAVASEYNRTTTADIGPSHSRARAAARAERKLMAMQQQQHHYSHPDPPATRSHKSVEASRLHHRLPRPTPHPASASRGRLPHAPRRRPTTDPDDRAYDSDDDDSASAPGGIDAEIGEGFLVSASDDDESDAVVPRPSRMFSTPNTTPMRPGRILASAMPGPPPPATVSPTATSPSSVGGGQDVESPPPPYSPPLAQATSAASSSAPAAATTSASATAVVAAPASPTPTQAVVPPVTTGTMDVEELQRLWDAHAAIANDLLKSLARDVAAAASASGPAAVTTAGTAGVEKGVQAEEAGPGAASSSTVPPATPDNDAEEDDTESVYHNARDGASTPTSTVSRRRAAARTSMLSQLSEPVVMDAEPSDDDEEAADDTVAAPSSADHLQREPIVSPLQFDPEPYPKPAVLADHHGVYDADSFDVAADLNLGFELGIARRISSFLGLAAAAVGGGGPGGPDGVWDEDEDEELEVTERGRLWRERGYNGQQLEWDGSADEGSRDGFAPYDDGETMSSAASVRAPWRADVDASASGSPPRVGGWPRWPVTEGKLPAMTVPLADAAGDEDGGDDAADAAEHSYRATSAAGARRKAHRVTLMEEELRRLRETVQMLLTEQRGAAAAAKPEVAPPEVGGPGSEAPAASVAGGPSDAPGSVGFASMSMSASSASLSAFSDAPDVPVAPVEVKARRRKGEGKRRKERRRREWEDGDRVWMSREEAQEMEEEARWGRSLCSIPPELLRSILRNVRPNDILTLAAVNRYLRHTIPVCVDCDLGLLHASKLEDNGIVECLDHPLLFKLSAGFICRFDFSFSKVEHVWGRWWKPLKREGKDEEIRLHRELLDDLRKACPSAFPDASTHDVNANIMNKFWFASAECGFYNGLSLIPQQHPVLLELNDYDVTLLGLAAFSGHAPAVELLIAKGALVNLPPLNRNVLAPLGIAAQCGDCESINVLLDAGIDVDEADGERINALVHACLSFLCMAGFCFLPTEVLRNALLYVDPSDLIALACFG
ncbi:hypothetical protein HDU96_003734 [Phlyctochytrium bullatum]|nr:hypothetical protein HDU96_003734 [Phlyctochytrium bullatum]